MNIVIDEDEMREWAINQIKRRMGDRINSLMRDWDWESYMKSAVNKIVNEKITDDAIKCLIGNINKAEIIKAISEHVAIEIAERMQD